MHINKLVDICYFRGIGALVHINTDQFDISFKIDFPYMSKMSFLNRETNQRRDFEFYFECKKEGRSATGLVIPARIMGFVRGLEEEELVTFDSFMLSNIGDASGVDLGSIMRGD